MGMKERTYKGQTSTSVSAREEKNRAIARNAAGQCVVLLKNEGILPLQTGAKLAMYGNAIEQPQKGGSGSGDVNCREVVGPVAGVLSAGFTLVNEAACQKRIEDCNRAHAAWANNIKEMMAQAAAAQAEQEAQPSQAEQPSEEDADGEKQEAGSDMGFMAALFGSRPEPQSPIPIVAEELASVDAAVYVLGRTAGEGRDRKAQTGDYYLTEQEEEELAEIAKYTDKIVFVLNTGAQIDISKVQANPSIQAIINLSQPGMEMGNVLADVLCGKVNPSGKLTTTWANRYEDYSNADTFGARNEDLDNEYYEEGIYVGYRYFDTFNIKPMFPFGYGLSYTSFVIDGAGVIAEDGKVSVTAKVTNTGADYAGREVVQVYVACPQNKQAKELKRLVGFAKTSELAPGSSETVQVSFDSKAIASFDYEAGAWIVEGGEYVILVGDCSDSVRPVAALQVAKDVVIEEVTHILPLKDELTEITPDTEYMKQVLASWKKEVNQNISYEPCRVSNNTPTENTALDQKVYEIADKMSNEELIAMLMGEITKGQDNMVEGKLVETGMYVPGAAGETSCRFVDSYGIPPLSMADGPAGLRLNREYDVDNETGMIYGQGILTGLAGGVFAIDYHRENVTTYHTYTTAIPIGTMLASSWDVDLLTSIGELIGEEMEEYGISWWLAPGMNIHRNPLCGRNFEYYSEDPLIAGRMAAAITRGVQSLPGIGTTIKHYACNNQEDNRMFNNSIVGERALREIYLRGFEIAIKESQPMCIMTSYNKINQVPTANSRDLIDVAARDEWGFAGIVMTDWTPTTQGCATSHGCMLAGNDLIMPGNQKDIDDLTAALADGRLPREKAVECAARIIKMVFLSSAMEDCQPYQPM